jgi:hypothetical protein
MLAMVVNDNVGSLVPRGVLESIASMLAPTEDHSRSTGCYQVPDLILVQARVRARSASRGSGCRV